MKHNSTVKCIDDDNVPVITVDGPIRKLIFTFDVNYFVLLLMYWIFFLVFKHCHVLR